MDVTRGCRGYEGALTHNWNGNVSLVLTSKHHHNDEASTVVKTPSSIEEVCDIVRKNKDGIRVVGRGHSFTSRWNRWYSYLVTEL